MPGEYSADKHPEFALKAVMNVVSSINKARTVGRLVYTSSCAAVLHEDDMEEFARRPVMWDKRYLRYSKIIYGTFSYILPFSHQVS